MDFPSIAEQAERPYISTGHLPEPDIVQRLVSDAHTVDRRGVLRTPTASSPPSPPASLGLLVAPWPPPFPLAAGVTEFEAS
jgi:hypothetical protein